MENHQVIFNESDYFKEDTREDYKLIRGVDVQMVDIYTNEVSRDYFDLNDLEATFGILPEQIEAKFKEPKFMDYFSKWCVENADYAVSKVAIRYEWETQKDIESKF